MFPPLTQTATPTRALRKDAHFWTCCCRRWMRMAIRWATRTFRRKSTPLCLRLVTRNWRNSDWFHWHFIMTLRPWWTTHRELFITAGCLRFTIGSIFILGWFAVTKFQERRLCLAGQSMNLAQEPDRSVFNSEILLIHLADLQRRLFSICLKILLDSKTNQLLLQIKRQKSQSAAL